MSFQAPLKEQADKKSQRGERHASVCKSEKKRSKRAVPEGGKEGVEGGGTGIQELLYSALNLHIFVEELPFSYILL